MVSSPNSSSKVEGADVGNQDGVDVEYPCGSAGDIERSKQRWLPLSVGELARDVAVFTFVLS
jgi:hypothetical protein